MSAYMPKGSLVVGRFGASNRRMRVVRHEPTGSTIVRHVDENGRAYGRPLEVPTLALAEPTEPRYQLFRRNELVTDDGAVSHRYGAAESTARGLDALRVSADLQVPASDRHNYFYALAPAGEAPGKFEPLTNLYESKGN